MNGFVGAFLAQARPRYRGNNGGGKPFLPMVPPVQHDSAMARSERDALMHRTMQEGGGAKETAPVSGGGESGHIQGLHCICMPPKDGGLFQIIGAGDLSGGQ